MKNDSWYRRRLFWHHENVDAMNLSPIVLEIMKSGMMDNLEIVGIPVPLKIEGVPTHIAAVNKSHGGEALFIHFIHKPCPTHGWDWLLFDVRLFADIDQAAWMDEFQAVEGMYPRTERLFKVKALMEQRDQSHHDVFRKVFTSQW